MLKEQTSFKDFKIHYSDDRLCFGIIEYHYILGLLVSNKIGQMNKMGFDDKHYENFSKSISFRYEQILAKYFEDYFIVLTENMKKNLILKPDMQKNTWNNYVKKIDDFKPNYEKILHIIKEKEYIKTDATTRIVEQYVKGNNRVAKHIIKNIVLHDSFTTRIIRKYIGKENLEKFPFDKNIIQTIVDYVGSFPKECNIWLHDKPLGAQEDRIQLRKHFNETIQNLFGDAAAFYFLYGPQKFMKSVENHIIVQEDPMKMKTDKHESDFVNQIIALQERSISQRIRNDFEKVFLKNLKKIVLKKQTSLTDFKTILYQNGIYYYYDSDDEGHYSSRSKNDEYVSLLKHLKN